MVKYLNSAAYLVVAIVAGLLSTGCNTPKNVAYFQDLQDMAVVSAVPQEIKIRPFDKLAIIVKTKDPALTSLFNLTIATDRLGLEVPTNGSGSSLRSYTGSSEGLAKYTVNDQGDIDFPVLGSLHIAGMTRSELSGFIKGELMGRELVKDPVVTVEFLNTGISVLGEVMSPGRYDMNKDALNILEALTLAGDLTIQGQRENVAVIREESGEIRTYRVDLTNFGELSKSPVYYLRQGDIIYVEPNDVRKRQTTANGNNVMSASFWVSVASLLTSAVTSIAVFVK